MALNFPAIRRAAAAVAILMAMAGCDRGEPANPATDVPVDPPAGGLVDPATPTTAPGVPATTQAAGDVVPAGRRDASVVTIDETRYEFPAARLLAEVKDDGLDVAIYSDDPREAIRSDYKGNSFYLRMELEVPEVGMIGRARWQYAAASSQPTEEPTGIFLKGRTWQLQPVDAQADFEQLGDRTVVWLSGRFIMFHPDEERGEVKLVPVAARLPVEIDRRSR